MPTPIPWLRARGASPLLRPGRRHLALALVVLLGAAGARALPTAAAVEQLPIPLLTALGSSGPDATGAARLAGGGGHWIVETDGTVVAVGDVPLLGDLGGTGVTAVDLAATRTGEGYWILTDDGVVHAFGDAVDHGSADDRPRPAELVDLAVTPTGAGYWILLADGSIWAFGDAVLRGRTANPITVPAVQVAGFGPGNGYWVLDAAGHVARFGDAPDHGSIDEPPAARVIGMAALSDGSGYWVATEDGAVHAFGAADGNLVALEDAPTDGVVGIVASATGSGYWLLTDDGRSVGFGDAAVGGYPPAGHPGVRVVTGAVEPPPPPPPPAPRIVRTAAPAPAPAPAPADDSVWDRLAQCESSGNWAANTGNGYYGGLQFSLSSWQAVGGTGYPHEHPRETQIEMGKRLQARQGWGAWPHCSRKLGLR